MNNLDSIKINRKPASYNELANKKYVDDSIEDGTILRFKQTLEKYLKRSVGNDTYNLTKYNQIQLTDTTTMKAGNTGGYLLPYWKFACNDKHNNGKIQKFLKSTKTNSPMGESGATSLPPIDNGFRYIETSSNNHGPNVFASWETTDLIQITHFTF